MTAREAGVVVGTLVRALLDGSRDLGTVPALLVRIINEDLWRNRVDPMSGKPYAFDTWTRFVTTSSPDGLGSTQKQLEGICRGNRDALTALAQVSKRPRGRPPKILDNIQDKAPTGTNQAAAFRRLQKDRPDLLARVQAKELTAHAAMIEAGFRHRTLTVRADDPERIAATLRRHLDHDARLKLAALLAQ